jgi:septal ring factor EnvC (AmiA/AmiB activator)
MWDHKGVNISPHLRFRLKAAGYLLSVLLIGLTGISVNEYVQFQRAEQFVVATEAENDAAVKAAESRIVRQRDIEKTTKKTIKNLKSQIAENEKTIKRLSAKTDSLNSELGR